MTRKISITIFLICSAIMLIGCNGNGNEKRTKVFAGYLQQVFNENMPNEKTVYIVVTSQGCPSCKTSLLDYLQTQSIPLNLLVTQDYEVPFPDNITLLYDDESMITRMDMGVIGTYALFVEKRKIVETFSITPPDLPLLDEKIKEFQ